MEEYLKGVLPSEMPALWPGEALKAQAVSARSEVLANLSTKHSLERFDFCNKEHCRAYRGVNLHEMSTTQALSDTRGEILVQDGAIVETVFSANCGGWTENNDTVWFGPPNAALRGTPDLANALLSPFGTAAGVREWIARPPAAFCSGDEVGFRWTLSYPESEIRAMMGKRYGVGSIKQIELGERGVSGRLKWIRIHGTADTVTIKKELPIRRALGGLPSAMFDLSVSGDAPRRTFTIRGAGRGIDRVVLDAEQEVRGHQQSSKRLLDALLEGPLPPTDPVEPEQRLDVRLGDRPAIRPARERLHDPLRAGLLSTLSGPGWLTDEDPPPARCVPGARGVVRALGPDLIGVHARCRVGRTGAPWR